MRGVLQSINKTWQEGTTMSEEWREFEKLITRIEAALAPLGAEVKSPDRVRDLVTGKLREVDATIRYKVGTVPILITVECRKRGRVQDDTWLEHLATKKQKVGAARTVAVSASGFSESSAKTARLYGIELRNIGEIASEDIRSWIVISGLQQVTDYTQLAGVRFEGVDQLPPETVVALKSDLAGAKIFTLQETSEKVSIGDMVSQLRQQGANLHEGVPSDGTTVRKEILLQFPEHFLSFETAAGPRELRLIQVGLDLRLEQVVTPLPAMGFEYSDTEQPLVRGVEHEMFILGQRVKLSLLKEAGSDRIRFSLTRIEEK
jgi:hypothetical protein